MDKIGKLLYFIFSEIWLGMKKRKEINEKNAQLVLETNTSKSN